MNPQIERFIQSLGRIPEFLADPQQNPQVAAVALGMIAALALIVVALMLLLFLQFTAKKRKKQAEVTGRASTSSPKDNTVVSRGDRAAARRTDERRRRIYFIGRIAGVAVLFALVAAGPFSVSQPEFCISCHASKPAYDTWKVSTHSGQGCLACHKSPGALGALELATQGAANAASSFLGTPSTGGGAKVRTAACVRCHGDVMNRTVVNNDIRVSHKEFLAAIPACTSCHRDTGHGAGEDTGPESTLSKVSGKTVMERCTSCHDGRQVSSSCSGCHTKDIGRQSHVDPDDLPRISISAVDLCTSCHAAEIRAVRQAAAKEAEPLVERVCTACHTLDRLKTSGIRGEGWSNLIRRMQLKGADFGAGESQRILNYLQITYP